MSVQLIVARGSRKGEVIPLAGRFLIGRIAGCQLRSGSSRVSRKHCLFQVYDDGAVTVRDFHSTNGTFVNGQRVEGEVPLRHGDRLLVGPLLFLLRLDRSAVADRPALAAIPDRVDDFAADLLLRMDENEPVDEAPEADNDGAE